MLTVYITAAALLAVVATGGRLKQLAEIRLRHTWVLFTALAVQVIIISLIPESRPALLGSAHVGSYLAAGAFLFINRRLPGAWMIGGGGALNGLVIAINGGTLPASAHALRDAGRAVSTDQFNNSAVLSNPHLAMFGDVFATPSWLPVGNVFSVGDIAIWLGVVWFLWRTCRPRPAPTGSAARSPKRLAERRRNGRTARHRPAPQAAGPLPASPADIAGSGWQRSGPDMSSGRPGRHRRDGHRRHNRQRDHALSRPTPRRG